MTEHLYGYFCKRFHCTSVSSVTLTSRIQAK